MSHLLPPREPAAQPPLPLLITGVSGVAGYSAWHYFRARYPGRVIGIKQRDNRRLAAPDLVDCDAEDGPRLAHLIRQHRFAAVLNCAGNCALKSCELDPAMARRVNVLGVENLLDALSTTSAHLLHLSVDLVFSGLRPGGYRETDPVDPVTVYGQTMVEAERLILQRRPQACILRISLPMGVSLNGHAGAIDWIQHRFRHQRPATLYFDEVRTPTYTDCLSALCEEVLARGMGGLFHAGGPRRLALYQIAQIINRVGGYDPRLLIGCPRADAGPMPPRAGDVSLDSSALATALGRDPFDPWPWDACWVPTDPDWHWHRSPTEPGSPELLAAVLYQNPNRLSQPRPPLHRPSPQRAHRSRHALR